jgi:hypothetical protein
MNTVALERIEREYAPRISAVPTGLGVFCVANPALKGGVEGVSSLRDY